MSNQESMAEICGRISQMLEYAQDKREPFTRLQMSEDLSISKRTTLRYLHALEASDFVECVECGAGSRPSYWQAGRRLGATNA